MQEKKFYYSENEETEREMIELFGIPNSEYDEAFERCICTDNYADFTTEALFEMVKPLEETYQGIHDLRKRKLSLTEHILLWNFYPAKQISYEMLIQKITL